MIHAIGISWEEATLAQREACARAAGSEQATLRAVAACPQVSGCVLLATCNRFEFYLDATRGEGLVGALCEAAGIALEERSSFACEGDAAARRLLEVASGLRSQILGEDQIITQVRDAQRTARELGTMSPVLETLLRTAVTCGKEVRANVRFAAVPPSAAHEAIARAQQLLGGLEGRRALVIGNGRVGQLAAELLVQHGAAVTVTLRSYRHRATTVPYGCAAVPYTQRAAALEGADLVVSATKSPHCTVSAAMLEGLQARPGVIVDLAVPRDVEPACAQLAGVRLLDIDALHVGGALRESPEMQQADAIVEKHLADFGRWLAAREARANPHGRVAVFAGTSEGRILCERLAAAGRPARAFVATAYGSVALGELAGVQVRTGHLDAKGMAEQLQGCSLVVDATHPYATDVSANVRQAARACGLRLLRLVRPQQQAGAGAVFVADAAEAAAFLAQRDGPVLSTCGSKEVGQLAATPELAERLWVRTLPTAEALASCLAAGVPQAHIVCMQGPFSVESNVALLHESGARWLVTKSSGAPGGFMQKVEAAEQVGAGLVVIARPEPHEAGLQLDELCRALIGGSGREAPGADGAAGAAAEGLQETGTAGCAAAGFAAGDAACTGAPGACAAGTPGAAGAAAGESQEAPGPPDACRPAGQEPGRRFPLFADIAGWPCLVVGAGAVGLRRADVLAAHGACVRVVAPQRSGELPAGVAWRQRPFSPEDVEGCRLAVAATDDRAVNAQVAATCHERGVPVSVADCPQECTFFFPAVCESGCLSAGVVSDGAHHALVAKAAAAVRSTLSEVQR